MSEILHQVRIAAPRERVHEALSTIDGLSKWWTTTTEGASAPGETIAFRFGEHVTAMRVESLDPARVAWRCVESHPDWVGTQVTFDLIAEGEGTVVRFGHREWAEASDFFAHCSMKWATFLLSLKGLLETGEGSPFPRDIPI